MDAEKAAAQAKLVGRLMQAVTTATSLTSIEVLGALEAVKVQIAFGMMMGPPPAVPPSREPANGSIIKP